jgi:hypothetical protein
MNDLIRPSLYGAWMDIIAVTPRTSESKRMMWLVQCAKQAIF